MKFDFIKSWSPAPPLQSMTMKQNCNDFKMIVNVLKKFSWSMRARPGDLLPPQHHDIVLCLTCTKAARCFASSTMSSNNLFSSFSSVISLSSFLFFSWSSLFSSNVSSNASFLFSAKASQYLVGATSVRIWVYYNLVKVDAGKLWKKATTVFPPFATVNVGEQGNVYFSSWAASFAEKITDFGYSKFTKYSALKKIK